MNNAERDQIVNIIANLEEQRGYIAYLHDLEDHPIYGNIFSNLDDEKKHEIRMIINDYLTEKIESQTKTKGGQLFKRFFEAYNELFRQFRSMNEYPDQDKEKFQAIGKQVEQEMFKLEGILTEKMFKQEKGLDKVVWSFYNIVYSYFPKYNQID